MCFYVAKKAVSCNVLLVYILACKLGCRSLLNALFFFVTKSKQTLTLMIFVVGKAIKLLLLLCERL